MKNRSDQSRRWFLQSLGSAVAVSSLGAAARKSPADVPVIRKRVEKVFRAPGNMPNGLQATPEGLWILDQENPNKAHLVSYKDGSVQREVVTESLHGSGITVGGGALWIASTYGLKTLKVDIETGKTLQTFDTPGVGYPQWGQPKRQSGAHGLEWVDDHYWIATPPSMTLYRVQPETGKVLHSIPAPGERPHGIAWDDGVLWCVESNHRAIYKIDPSNGEPLAKIELGGENPEPHGMSLIGGVFWYCDAESRWVCRLV